MRSYMIRTVSYIGILSAAGIMLNGCLGKTASYSTDIAGFRSIAEDVEASGDVHGIDSTTYYSTVTAPINFYDLKVGDEVKAGQPAVGYDLEDLVKLRDQAILTAKSAENTMNGQVQASNSNQAKFNKASSDIDIYRMSYALFRQANDYINQGQYQENWDVSCIAAGINKDLAQKSADVNTKSLELQEAQAAQDVKKAEELLDEIEELNQDIAELNQDLAGLPPATLSPEEYAETVINGNWMSDIMRNWTEASTLKNTYENQILNSYQKEQLRNSYDLTELNVETAEENVAKASAGVSIEEDGIITESFVANGSVVSKGAPLFTVESTNDIKVDVGISKYDIGKIETGQSADITIAGNKYEGTVYSIKRLAETKDSDKAKVTVSVKLNDPDEKVYLGLEADVTIHTTEKQGILTIPSEAYYSDDEGDYCYTIRDGIVEKQYVTVGSQTDDYMEVTAGLGNGDIVITDAVTDDAVGKKAEPGIKVTNQAN
ncbi:MAG: efflux RND transporter periplasmic adaptor subunit [Lachnospiraceae bacterium]|nr:efflux RND transporter periplasmic adaptor subunit [Lachnospiraceae bacterium]